MKAVIHNAQVLRFVAAFMVLFGHVQHEAAQARFLAGGSFEPWMPVFFPGGVDIFFVISGFIMAHLAHEDFGRPGASLSFMKRRLLRVAPLYWLCTTAMLLATLVFAEHIAHHVMSWSNVLASYFFVPWPNAYGRLFPVLILGWTLNFEMFFYGVMAISLLFSRRIGYGVLFGIVGVFGVLGALSLPLPPPFLFWANTIAFEFLMGVVLAYLRRSGLRMSPCMAWALIAGAVGLMLAAQASGLAGHAWFTRPLWMGVPAMMVCAAAVLSPEAEPGPIKRWFSAGGDLSYSLYLSHPFSLTAMAVVWSALQWTDPWTYVWVAVLVSLVAAHAVHRFIEVPLTRAVNRRMKGESHA